MINLSIILPMYNVAGYLEKCVKSVMNTNLGGDSFEIIFVDDESPDNSKIVAKDIIKRYPEYNFKLISQTNKGLGGARNTGIDNAEGDYLIFLDPDDFIVDNNLEETLQNAKSNNLDILEFNATMVNSKGETIQTVKVNSYEKILSGIIYSNLFYCSGSACNKLYSRGFLNQFDLRFMEKVYGEDFEFNTRVFFHASRVKGLNKVVSAFLQSPNSITRNRDIDKKIKYLKDYIKILTNLKSYFSNIEVNQTSDAIIYYKSRMALINTNSFILLIKNKFPTDYALQYRKRLENDDLLFITSEIVIKKKNLVRKFLFQYQGMFFIVFKLNNIIKGTIKLPL
ncbi:glycosyltransferase [Croceivirga radicis]|uniref:glycosyltransferase n=1 Tax=Croceivirga radicis TaxID=1929488 RepID=UPI000255B2BA|nr:glycosyltransferase [Croceivirga radicis]